MLFTDAERYYDPTDSRWYQQGDVVLAPIGIFDTNAGEHSTDAPAIGSTVRRIVWLDREGSSAGDLTVEAGVVPAMIVTHDCSLDKEFNRSYARLRRQGLAVEDARRQAAQDESLDRLVTIAPVVPFEDAAPSTQEELERNNVLGWFPVCASAERAVDAGVVDLMRHATVDRDAVIDRLGILSVDARGALRYALARFWVFRAPKLTFELEDAVGQRIVDARVADRDPMLVELELQDHTVLQLVQAPSVEAGPGARPGLA